MKTATKSIAGKILITLITILNLTFSSSVRAYDNPLRGMYVNGLITQGILGNNGAENSLLQYAKENHISYLILYELNSVWGNTTLESDLCDFISKAKSQYCISKIGAAGECQDFFTNLNSFNALMITPPYLFSNSQIQALNGNTSMNFVQQQYSVADGSVALMAELVKSSLRMLDFNSTCAYKIDALVTEHEFWNAAPPCPGNHCLCQIYTDPTLDYLNDYIPLLDYMNVVKSLSTSYPLTVETYIGWLHIDAVNDLTQAQDIDIRTDFILLHCYVGNPSGAYGYANAQSRLALFGDASTKPLTKICPIFSVEPSFMGPWVNSNPTTTGQTIFAAERQFLDDMASGINHAYGDNIIIPGGFIYFEYTYMPSTTTNALYPANNVLFIDPTGNCSGTPVNFAYTGPYEAGTTFDWVFGDGNSTTVVNPAYASQGTSHTYHNAGTYVVSLTLNYPSYLNDPAWLGGCSSYTYTRSITVNGTSITPNGSTTFCQGGSVLLTATTGSSYFWTTPSGTHPTTPSITATVNGDYSVTVANSNGCGTSTALLHVTVNPLPVTNVSTTSPLCNGGADGGACANAIGGATPYNYSWSCTGQTTACILNMPATSGCIVIVTDNNNCSSSPSTFDITEPDILTLSETHNDATCAGISDGNIDITVSGGTPSYTYAWASGQTTEDILNLLPDNYSVIVTDANSCTASISIDIGPVFTCNADIQTCDNATTSVNLASYTFGQSIAIHSDLLVDADFTINGSNVLIDPNVSIIIGAGVKLTIENSSHLHACSDMWQGIILSDPLSVLYVTTSSLIEDAENAIYSDVGGEIHISLSTFNLNYNDINLNYADYSTSTIRNDNTFQGGILSLSPHNGQLSNAHILMSKASNLKIGDGSGGYLVNNFNGSLWGIYGKDCDILQIENNIFNDETAGVYLYTDPANTTWHHSNIGQYSVPSSNIFNRCRRAIFITNQGIYIHFNEFNDCSTAIHTQQCIQRYGYIYSNVMNNVNAGIFCSNNNLTELGIDANIINTTTSLFSSGIVVNDLPSVASYTSTTSNIISSYGSGIIYRNNYASLISGNIISLPATSTTPLTNLSYGVRIENCLGMYVICNTVAGASTSWYNFNIEKSGISASFSPKSIFDCNSTDLTYHGLQFLANCQNAFIKGNSMYRDVNGLTLGAVFNGGWSSGIIGDQTFYVDGTNHTYGNRFEGWGSGLFLNGSMHSINSNAQAYFYYYNSNDPFPPLSPYTFQDLGGCVCTVPFLPINPGFTDYYECPIDCINHHPEPRDNDISEYLQSLTGNSGDGDEMDNLKWSLRQGLFEEIKKDTTLLDSFPILQAFFDTIPATSEGIFTEVMQLLSSLSDSTIAPDSASKEAIIELAETKNNSVNGAMIYEYNRKIINTITMETVARNNFDFSVTQKETVEAIAFQCPYIGGTAVFEARAIMQNWNDSVYFDDYNLCDNGSYFRISSKNETKYNYLSIYPNPPSDIININYILHDESKATLSVIDVTGRIVYSKTVASIVSQLQISTSSFAPGSYLVEISTDNKEVLRGKFNIIK